MNAVRDNTFLQSALRIKTGFKCFTNALQLPRKTNLLLADFNRCQSEKQTFFVQLFTACNFRFLPLVKNITINYGNNSESQLKTKMFEYFSMRAFFVSNWFVVFGFDRVVFFICFSVDGYCFTKSIESIRCSVTETRGSSQVSISRIFRLW